MTLIEKKVDILCRLALDAHANHDTLKKQLSEIMLKKPAKHVTTDSAVRDALRNVAVPVGIQGYEYLAEAVSIAVKNPHAVRNMTNDGGVYASVAKKFGTTVSRVERSIRHAIERSASECDPEILYNVFRGSISANKGKPTNREFISVIAEFVREELREE